jgi:hypothetical protein
VLMSTRSQQGCWPVGADDSPEQWSEDPVSEGVASYMDGGEEE